RGPHAWDARRRLTYLTAAIEPPPSFPMMAYDEPPPPPEEMAYIDQPAIEFDDPMFAFAPPPPPPVFLLPPVPVEFFALPPPAPPVAVFVLPVPVYVPVPVWVRPPPFIAPAHNIIFANLHNRVAFNSATNTATITTHSGETHTITPQTVAAIQPATGSHPAG